MGFKRKLVEDDSSDIQTFVLDGSSGSVKIETPEGTLVVTRFPKVGTTINVWGSGDAGANCTSELTLKEDN